MTSHNFLIMSGEEVQGIRTGPLVASLILLFLSCILTLVSLNSDWASMSVEMEYTSDERDAAYNFGYELPELSMDVFLECLSSFAGLQGEHGHCFGVILEMALAMRHLLIHPVDFGKTYGSPCKG